MSVGSVELVGDSLVDLVVILRLVLCGFSWVLMLDVTLVVVVSVVSMAVQVGSWQVGLAVPVVLVSLLLLARLLQIIPSCLLLLLCPYVSQYSRLRMCLFSKRLS